MRVYRSSSSMQTIYTKTVSHLLTPLRCHFQNAASDTIFMSLPPDGHLRLTLRIPKELADVLRKQAGQNLRSLNKELVSRLQQSRANGIAEAEKAKGHTAPTVAPSCESTPSKEDGTRHEC
ncbi:Arc family DNA-binding protein [Variovorax paradoxus]|uniref:Arc family DNA-binding protein n=1 Tax=Variovorax paradoxus TaxID=34073 RepID=UPI003D7C2932